MLIFKNEFKFILNFAEGPFKIRMDTTPLYYDLFPGSIIDQLHVFGYQNVGLLFDRGYFSEPNVRELDAHGFEFIMMLRDDQNFVKKLIKAHVSMLRDNPDAYVSGMEVFGLDVDKEKHMLKSYSVKDDKVNDRIACAGFFVIMTSESLEADVTLDIYRGRDNIEKFFRGIKSGMDFDSPGVYDNQSLAAKIHLMFIAGIIRNRFSIASAAIKNVADAEFKKWVLEPDGYVTTMEKSKYGKEVPFTHKSRLYAKEITKKDSNGARRLKMKIYQKQMVYYSEKYAKNRGMKGKKPS